MLALLRIDTRESRRLVEDVLGLKIRLCPPGIPPWPPKPVQRKLAASCVASYRTPNPCLPTTGAFRRYALIRRGMTEEQLRRRGVTRRDILRWTKLGYLEWTPNPKQQGN